MEATMICRLCLKEVNEFKSAFAVTENKPTMASVVRIHFWFELQQNDPISTVICNSCWCKVSDFHDFYKSVEEAQSHLGENVTVKIENISAEHSIENVMIPSFSLSSKQEPEVNFDEVNDEVPFDMTTVETPSTRTGFRTDDSHDIWRSQKSSDNNAIEDIKDIIDYKDEIFSDHNSDPVNRTTFAENEESNKVTINKKGINKTNKLSVKAQRKVPLAQKIHCKNGRAAKVPEVEKSNVKKTKELSEQAKAIREQGLAFDGEIAKFMSLHCELCKVTATNFSSLHTHMLAEHKINGYVRCCNKKFSKRFALLDHIRHHSNPERFKCEQCNRVYANRNSMRTHFLSKHKNDKEKVFTCSQCPQKFFKKYLLRKHELFGHSDHKNACIAVDEEIANFMPLRCELCNEESTNFTALKGHMRDEHNVKGYVRCCNKKFSEHGLLVEHIRAHLNPACYKCEECSLVFPDRQSMRNHFLMEHGKMEDKPFACSLCSSKFVTVYLLHRHTAVVHGDHSKTCSSCRKKFETAAQLSAHVKEQCLCDTCAEVVCGAAALQHHLLKHKKNYVEMEEEECS